MVLDVREPDEYEQGAIPGAVHIPRGHLESQVEGRIADQTAPIVVYCAGGVRSAFAAKTLSELGYTDVVSMAGGFNKWKDEGRDVAGAARSPPSSATATSATSCCPRSARRASSSCSTPRCCCSAPAASARPPPCIWRPPAWARIGIIDMDVVDASNLQRQILHNLDRIGERKVDSAKKTLTLLNPDVNVVTYDTRLAPTTCSTSSPATTSIVDGADNFPSRYLLNDALGEARHPGGARLDLPVRGQATVFDPRAARTTATCSPSRRRPSWRRAARRRACSASCRASSARCRRSRPSSSSSTLASPLIGRILTFDALEMSFRTYKLQQDPSNPVTYANRDAIEIAEYDDLCAPHLSH